MPGRYQGARVASGYTIARLARRYDSQRLRRLASRRRWRQRREAVAAVMKPRCDEVEQYHAVALNRVVLAVS